MTLIYIITRTREIVFGVDRHSCLDLNHHGFDTPYIDDYIYLCIDNDICVFAFIYLILPIIQVSLLLSNDNKDLFAGFLHSLCIVVNNLDTPRI